MTDAPKFIITSNDEVLKIEAALKKDAAEAKKHKKNQEEISKLQTTEQAIISLIDSYTEDLEEIQDEIVKKSSLKFDFSDPVTTKTMKQIVRVAKKQLKNQSK